MNCWGQNFRLSLFGESHGQCVGVTIDGLRAGIVLDEDTFVHDLDRRRGASSVGTTTRSESDTPHIISGVLDRVTTGAPLTIIFDNNDTQSSDYKQFASHPRPSHVDWVAGQKWGRMNDYRGGGHFSARLTLPLVAAGVVAKRMLAESIHIEAKVIEIGGHSTDFDRVIGQAMADSDSLGAIIECRAIGLPVGLGEPFFDSVESLIAHLLFAIGGVRGVEFGSGFAAAKMRGSQHNDPIIDQHGHTLTNHAGGVVGGLTNGNQMVVRVAMKPTSSIAKTQQTFNFTTQKIEPLTIGGRHDACIALRAAVVVEAAVALVINDLYLNK